MRHLLALGTLSISLLLEPVPAGSSAPGLAIATLTNSQVTIAWQQGLKGQIRQNCGCGYTCRGGLARRATCIDSLRRAHPELILVDAGGFLAENDTIRRPADLAVLREMERLHYDAVGLGEDDVRQLAFLEPLLADSTVPIVCTNVELLRGEQWQPLGRRSRVLSSNGIRVGILSAVVEDSAWAEATERIMRANPKLPDYRFKSGSVQVRYLPVVETCREEARKLRGAADVIVLMVDVPRDLVGAIAREVPEIDLIVGGVGLRRLDAGPRPGPVREPVGINRTFVLTTAAGGSLVAVTRLAISPDGEIVEFDDGVVILDSRLAEDPEVARTVERVSAEIEEATRMRHEE
jgi:2',3'-cyclic-nucleotide 2'-phosphodiesterase (5'-nucleotidase family)